jgi:ARG and Rhodanese-Phosphatase-superfamily-associated Protein domain
MEFELIPRSFDFPAHFPGRLQSSGVLSVLPLFGPDHGDTYTPPLSGLKLAGVRGYGNVELNNPAPAGVTIVPLHVGFIQDAAQNHCLCGSMFLGAGQKRLVEDACCVQQAQGGYLESREQWFFVLPLALREEALGLRGQKSYSKLWGAIAGLNARFGLESRGHLEALICRQRPVLTQFQSRLEPLPGQTGALFFLHDRLVGVEVAPSAAYFNEVWMPLVCFCYGTAALEAERARRQTDETPEPLQAQSLGELRVRLEESRQQRLERIRSGLARMPVERFQRHEQERYLGARLFTVLGERFTGQYVEEEGRLVYASLTARLRVVKEALAAGPSEN